MVASTRVLLYGRLGSKEVGAPYLLVRQTSHPEKLWIATLYSDLHDGLQVRNHDGAGDVASVGRARRPGSSPQIKSIQSPQALGST